MVKIKVFCEHNPDAIEKRINEFFITLGDKQIIDVVQSESVHSITISIIYLVNE